VGSLWGARQLISIPLDTTGKFFTGHFQGLQSSGAQSTGLARLLGRGAIPCKLALALGLRRRIELRVRHMLYRVSARQPNQNHRFTTGKFFAGCFQALQAAYARVMGLARLLGSGAFAWKLPGPWPEVGTSNAGWARCYTGCLGGAANLSENQYRSDLNFRISHTIWPTITRTQKHRIPDKLQLALQRGRRGLALDIWLP